MLHVEQTNGVTRITLARPNVRNAFNDALIEQLCSAFTGLGDDTQVVVLAAEGSAFCAGADLDWMQSSITKDEQANLRDAERLSAMMQAVDRAPCPVIARVRGAALGGGAGLAACCDIVVCERSAKFGFTEVRLGLVPAVISPFVLRRIGSAAARRYFVTGEIFGADQALKLGLVDEVVASEALDATVEAITKSILACAKEATRAAKRLVHDIECLDDPQAHAYAAKLIASLRVKPEAQERMQAFLQRRKNRL